MTSRVDFFASREYDHLKVKFEFEKEEEELEAIRLINKLLEGHGSCRFYHLCHLREAIWVTNYENINCIGTVMIKSALEKYRRRLNLTRQRQKEEKEKLERIKEALQEAIDEDEYEEVDNLEFDLEMQEREIRRMGWDSTHPEFIVKEEILAQLNVLLPLIYISEKAVVNDICYQILDFFEKEDERFLADSRHMENCMSHLVRVDLRDCVGEHFFALRHINVLRSAIELVHQEENNEVCRDLMKEVCRDLMKEITVSEDGKLETEDESAKRSEEFRDSLT